MNSDRKMFCLGILLYIVNCIDALTARNNKECRVDQIQINGFQSTQIYCTQFLHLDEKKILLNKNIDSSEELGLHFIFCDGQIGPASFSNLRNITSLSLSSCNLEEVIFPKLPHLKYLVIDNSQIPKISLETFQNLKNLKKLLIISNEADINDKTFDGLDSLEVLHLFKQNVTLNKNLLNGLKKLRELKILEAGIKHVEASAFQETPVLQILSLEGNPIVNIENGAFNQLKHLEELSIRFTNLKKIDLKLLSELRELKSLGIPVRAVKDIDLTKLRQYCPHLSTLLFFNNDKNCPELKRLQNMITKTQLSLQLHFDGNSKENTC